MPQLRRAQWIPVGVIVLAVVIDLVTPPDVTSAPLLMAAPVAAAPLLGLRGIIGVGIASMVVHAVLAWVDGTFGWRAGVANQITLASVTALAVLINRTLHSQHARTRRAEQIAAIAQTAVLPRPPARIGALHIAARYVPAEDEATIGGDLYVVQATPYGTRVMVGDVRGKGLGAVSAVSADIGAFRYAADEAEDLPQLVNWLERALLREGERRGGQQQEEGFTTALIAEFSTDLDVVRLVNRGHPPPLLLAADGSATLLEASEEAPPLGMSALGMWSAPVDSFAFPPGSTLLCYTDGVTESRDATGTFYDPVVRLPLLLGRRTRPARPAAPGQILDTLIQDVRRHSGGTPQDDQALLALHHPRPGQEPAPDDRDPSRTPL
ncbi:PP2C family protein-serine/threonine phosphatase [Streptomyces sp. DT24]|uniref:PP2C family protein-serine/threonine phosphatase n=1 Tax=unclassified Streptomyces TaxID=2593676 RepID=UPI0023B99CEB|nr:PP2C family protein-serine/threonine phosphatase [Streptomyces sp. AM 4-1-1]WEH36923.1 PP2C family protein-serine/threonine phosphatase [Streptomyces sp. AM 4-1-1]